MKVVCFFKDFLKLVISFLFIVEIVRFEWFIVR